MLAILVRRGMVNGVRFLYASAGRKAQSGLFVGAHRDTGMALGLNPTQAKPETGRRIEQPGSCLSW